MFSFFGDQDGKQPRPPVTVVSKVSVVKKTSTSTSSSTPRSPAASASNANGNGHLKVPSSSTSTSKGKINGSSPIKNGSSSTPSPLSRPTLLKKVSSAKLDSKPSSSPRPATSKSSPARSPIPKRKANLVARIESESESSGSDSESSDDALDPKPKLKRRKGSPTGTSTPTSLLGRDDDFLGRKDELFCLDEVDMRGEYDRGWVGFVGCEEVLNGKIKGWASGSNGWGENGKGLEKYQAYFPQPGFENGENPPSVELLYPAEGCREKFVLLTPASPREFNPISELRTALRLILEHYIPPSHTHIFGTLSDSLSDPLETPSSLPSRLTSPFAGSLATPPPDSMPTETIGDALRKALAPNRRDGPGFMRAMERFNSAMEELQCSGLMKSHMKVKQMKKKEWSVLVDFVHDSAYSRVVGPYSHELEHHPKHPTEVAEAISGKEDAYGELRHNFMSRVIEQTKLGPDSVFVDLGSGVGNCVLQAALQAGSRSYGFELLPVPAHCARLQLKEVQRRWTMWGLKGNLNVEVHEGDFRVHPMVAKRLREADVVLVNNEVFPSSLNIDLTNMFLDLKDGAKIVSLKPFVPEGFRMNESNCDSFGAIVKSSQHTYYQDWVTWKGDSGKYYVQIIDRTKRAKFEEEMMSGRRSRR
ncbi:hypothetical protein I302_103969 [Kwoniella bestiolae CBS 10118]|uniref:Histone-lysine N-methyltransferase, H3 lysine-79 specific n=1 Tax=Kwoniella bestiolae CBS 10118 TaxID=1296100 RepID=A0A1B9G9Y5_9TREE|nr:histone-lysine N-methyltransferase, H3 lysine-79 specific [Kwoniella bestiolae CBS 10118]OCF27826.1 histone-lysine N-methyltransferase, H3 lysine-79 specific [Kwoniella bestiolae CBS 10118]